MTVIFLKTAVTIPSYWSRGNWRDGDEIYDHPTPLDGEGTLHRALSSLSRMNEKGFRTFVIAAPASKDIERKTEKKLSLILKSSSLKDAVLFGPSKMGKLLSLLSSERKEYADFLSLYGYPNIRNLCLLLPCITGSDAAVLIDDDEIEDPDYMTKAKEFVGKKFRGREIHAVAGYYIQAGGGYHLKKASRKWMRHWGQVSAMNRAFSRFISRPPRLKKTPFVFGGNMIIHRTLFSRVPFDPNIRRGEDIDYLIDARMFGFDFWLDRTLFIKHQPPPKTHPAWMQLREDIHRFVYEREKIRKQFSVRGMVRVSPSDFDPYPGRFLRDDLDEMIEKVSMLLSKEYLSEGDRIGSREALRNIEISKTLPKRDPFRRILETRKLWEGLVKYTGKREVRSALEEIIL